MIHWNQLHFVCRFVSHPNLDTFFDHNAIRMTIDSGATGNMIRASAAMKLGVSVNKSSQSAHQADGSSPLLVGETQFTLTRDHHNLTFEGLVVENLDVEVLAGTPFMETNDVSIRPAKHQVLVGDSSTFANGSRPHAFSNPCKVRRAHVLCAPPRSTTGWPGEFIKMTPPDDFANLTTFAVEPSSFASGRGHTKSPNTWPPAHLFV